MIQETAVVTGSQSELDFLLEFIEFTRANWADATNIIRFSWELSLARGNLEARRSNQRLFDLLKIRALDKRAI